MTWKNDTGKPIYRDQADNIVDEDDPNAAFLVVGVDGSLPTDKARKYGLVKDEAPAEKSVKAAPADKAVKQSTKEDK